MKKTVFAVLTALLLAACAGAAPAGTAEPTPSPTAAPTEASAAVAGADDMAAPVEVLEAGMEPVYADSLRDGVYPIEAASSSSMFKIVSAELTVKNGAMTAVLTMSGTGYLYVYPGSAEEAAAAPESERIPFAETDGGMHTFTVPVPALDSAVPCAAFSKKKEMWYDRTLVFRADSLPMEAFAEGTFPTAESLSLADGSYTAAVTLAGGSGKASVESPAVLTVESGAVTATLVWSSANYDYMVVDGQRYDALSMEEHSVFAVPVACFDRALPVTADTIAMSTPHEVEYTLFFDSISLQEQP